MLDMDNLDTRLLRNATCLVTQHEKALSMSSPSCLPEMDGDGGISSKREISISWKCFQLGHDPPTRSRTQNEVSCNDVSRGKAFVFQLLTMQLFRSTQYAVMRRCWPTELHHGPGLGRVYSHRLFGLAEQ